MPALHQPKLNLEAVISLALYYCPKVSIYPNETLAALGIKEKREIELLSTTATQRLQNFNNDFPEIAEEISSVILASYLGISAIQLSRIKSKL